MGKEYKLVIPNKEEVESLLKFEGHVGCMNCIALDDNYLCNELNDDCFHHIYSYYIEVEKDDK